MTPTMPPIKHKGDNKVSCHSTQTDPRVLTNEIALFPITETQSIIKLTLLFYKQKGHLK